MKNFLLDFFFPVSCVGCKKPKTHCCDECFNSIQLKPETSNDTFSLAEYKEKETLARLIHRFKYDGAEEIGPLLASLFRKIPPPDGPAMLVPVPLHWRRKNARGFNQGEILAFEIGKIWNLPVKNLLRRHRPTRPQAELNGEARRKNLKDAFAINKAQQVDSSTIWLIDDVVTTGTTLLECTKILKEYGAERVHGLALARAS